VLISPAALRAEEDTLNVTVAAGIALSRLYEGS
jgi:hypothetical protein